MYAAREMVHKYLLYAFSLAAAYHDGECANDGAVRESRRHHQCWCRLNSRYGWLATVATRQHKIVSIRKCNLYLYAIFACTLSRPKDTEYINMHIDSNKQRTVSLLPFSFSLSIPSHSSCPSTSWASFKNLVK